MPASANFTKLLNELLVDPKNTQEVELTPMDSERGEALRNLFFIDLDRCHCNYEMLDADPSHKYLSRGDDGRVGKLPPKKHRMRIHLQKEALLTKDFDSLFVEASKIASRTPLEARDLQEAARLVPMGSGLEGIEVEGLSCVLAVTYPELLGFYIQNYVNCGIWIDIGGVQKISLKSLKSAPSQLSYKVLDRSKVSS